MTQNEIEAELENLKQQLLLLQKEHGNTRGGWINWLRRTGLLLALFGGAILYGIWQSHAQAHSNPVAITLAVMGIFMLGIALYLWLCSLPPIADRAWRTVR